MPFIAVSVVCVYFHALCVNCVPSDKKTKFPLIGDIQQRQLINPCDNEEVIIILQFHRSCVEFNLELSVKS